MPSSRTASAYFTRSREGAGPSPDRLADLPQTAWAAITAASIKKGPNTPAPRNGTSAHKILRAEVMKIAHDYSHKRYRAVCSDLTRKERKHLGDTSKCMLAIAVVHAVVKWEGGAYRLDHESGWHPKL